MITKRSSFWIVSCDSCSYEEEFDADEYDWEDVIAEIKYYDWAVKKIRGEWRHTCPDCIWMS